MKEINLKITRGENQKLILSAKTMNELVEKIIEWQLWENQPLRYYQGKGRLSGITAKTALNRLYFIYCVSHF